VQARASGQADSGARADLIRWQEREEIRRLRKENFELRRANEILKSASVFFAKGARRRPTEVSAYIDEHRERLGVEPICRTLGVSALRLLRARERDPVDAGALRRAPAR